MNEKNNSETKNNLSNENLSEVTGGKSVSQAINGRINPGGQTIPPTIRASRAIGRGKCASFFRRGNTRCECNGKDPKCPQCVGTGYYNT